MKLQGVELILLGVQRCFLKINPRKTGYSKEKKNIMLILVRTSCIDERTIQETLLYETPSERRFSENSTFPRGGGFVDPTMCFF